MCLAVFILIGVLDDEGIRFFYVANVERGLSSSDLLGEEDRGDDRDERKTRACERASQHGDDHCGDVAPIRFRDEANRQPPCDDDRKDVAHALTNERGVERYRSQASAKPIEQDQLTE